MDNPQTINRVDDQTRRVKQEAIDDSWSLLHDAPQAEFSYFTPQLNSSEVILVPPPRIADTIPAAETAQPVKEEQDPELLLLLDERWDSCKVLLLQIWNALPAVPSTKSRCAWAKAHGVRPADVHKWFSGRKSTRKRQGIKAHPDDGYELRVEQPSELLPTPSGGELELDIRNAPQASSSLAPSSPPRTPELFDWSIGPGISEPFAAAWNSAPSPVVPRLILKFQTTPLVSIPLPEALSEYKEVRPREATETVPVAPAPKAKPGRKRKAVVDEGEVPAKGKAKATTKAAPKRKRPKVETNSAVNAPAPATTGDTSESKDTGEGPSSFDPKAPTSHTVLPHSFAAETYTSILIAPFVFENAPENAPNPPETSSSSSLAPVKEPLVAEPSPYTTQPLPPLPTFDTLGDPVAFVKDCRDALRISLEINYDVGLWDPVVEALPPSYFMDLGKDFDDFEWPEIDWP
ncbi:hypothetical protein FS749_004425 [Ceratobasidium sp. UAMH 11750]|nr:hypothetical protein FS749_004425 [Ceratobasidium sp. UAMH 11750]